MKFGTIAASGALLLTVAVIAAGCATETVEPTATATSAPSATATPTATAADFAASYGDCDAMAATFRTVTSANPDSVDPTLSATCDGDSLIVASNSIPDYQYVATTPEVLQASEQTVTIPVNPVDAATPTDIPMLGTIAVAVNGVAIYGPTESTGGDVLSLVGALSECGSHSSPVQFHMHLFGWADAVDCLYPASEAESGDSTVVGWSPDGYPIMSGLVCADDTCSSTTQLASSWQLTDESLFASDTWSAHSYVEGSGDLDQCNGRVDSDGQYRYYTTTTFPYFLGCYHGEVADDAIVGSGGAPGGPPARG
ncbi:YHYH protein [Salinibacterium sp. G-O1]|uniref:YHYH protein n=1 Tax=Salinibacterium sp. G-O1 TaxID=3046208 RepID=UPI0024BB4FA5|nr:YHYH protein [Salinibacterium sp. G-O1]MDJ0336038.1 YHYH protein [Salinibacterium sp. G-O1]